MSSDTSGPQPVPFTQSTDPSPAISTDWSSLNNNDNWTSIGGEYNPFDYSTVDSNITHIPFAHEPLTTPFVNAKFGSTVSAALNKACDYIIDSTIHYSLPGIAGQRTADYVSPYPHLVSNDDCNGTSTHNCIPSQERLWSSYDWNLGQDAYDASVDEVGADASLQFSPFAHWNWGSGWLLTDIQLRTGAQVGDQLKPLDLYVLAEIQGAAGKRDTYSVGAYDTREDCIRHSQGQQELYVRLPFFYTKADHLSLNVANSQLVQMEWRLTLPRLSQLITVATPNTKVVLTKSTPSANWGRGDGDRKDEPSPYEPTSNPILDTSILVEKIDNCIYTTDEFRQMQMYGSMGEEQYQMGKFHCMAQKDYASNSGRDFRVGISGNNPITDIHIMVRLQANADAGRAFNFSRIGPEPGGTGGDTLADGVTAVGHDWRASQSTGDREPLQYLGLFVNGTSRWRVGLADEFRILNMQRTHTSFPNISDRDAFIYTLPLSIHPEHPYQAYGSLNPARVRSLDIRGRLNPGVGTESTPCTVFAMVSMWALWTYKKGTTGHQYLYQYEVTDDYRS